MRYDKIHRREGRLKAKLDSAQKEISRLESAYEEVKDILDDILHEIRSFNNIIKHNSETANIRIDENNEVKKNIETIFFSAGLISARMEMIDAYLNPSLFISDQQQKFKNVVYKKFDKARYIFSQPARKEKKRIVLEGNSNFILYSGEMFDLLPVLLLDNAIKYSPPDSEVVVSFEEINNELTVKVASMGPYITESELKNIFNRGFRGKNSCDHKGKGVGLHFAKTICDIYKITIKAESDNNKTLLNDKDYSLFTITLNFKKHE